MMTDTKTHDLPLAQPNERLPCRGCPASCPHCLICEGKPWRMIADVVAPQQHDVHVRN